MRWSRHRPGLFFPIGTTGMAIEQIQNAKDVCDQCNAKAACLEFMEHQPGHRCLGRHLRRGASGDPSSTPQARAAAQA